MLVTWKGNGLFVPVVFAGVIALCITAAFYLMRLESLIQLPDWAFGASVVAAVVVCWCLGRLMHAPPGKLSPRVQRLLWCEPGERHELWFVKFEYWGLVFVASACGGFLAGD